MGETGKTTCIIYGNCQGTGMHALLELSGEFAAQYEVVVVSNWQGGAFPFERMAGCGLFLYQPTKARGPVPSTEQLAGMMPRQCRCLSFPYMYCNAFWPFQQRSPRTNTGPAFPAERHYYADSVLDEMARTALPAARVKNAYQRIVEKCDLGAVLEKTLALQEQKEAGLDVKTADFVRHCHRKAPLFFTVRHPSPLLYLVAANTVLALLGLRELPADCLGRVRRIYNVDYFHPIHPAIIAALGVEFADARSTYNLWGEAFTYDQYLDDYIAHRRLHYALEQA